MSKREILFRGKHRHILPGNEHLNGIWVYGYLSDKNYINSMELEGEFLIEPETVCQYTGLTDKNGRKIFEGDIVSAWNEGSHATGRVKQRIDGLWLLYPAWQNKIMWGLCPNNKGETTAEIIGNIFDNPELLN